MSKPKLFVKSARTRNHGPKGASACQRAKSQTIPGPLPEPKRGKNSSRLRRVTKLGHISQSSGVNRLFQEPTRDQWFGCVVSSARSSRRVWLLRRSSRLKTRTLHKWGQREEIYESEKSLAKLAKDREDERLKVEIP
jgi:hypothetical protein